MSAGEKLTVWIDEIEVEIATKFGVCPRCRGKGSHVNPAIDGNGLSQEDFDREGPEFREDYMAGVYDVACYDCKGKRVVMIPDADRLSKEERAAWYQQVRDLADMAAEEEAERRFGC